MPETVDIIIGYYGGKDEWGPLAQWAKKSALEQTHQPYTVFTVYRAEGLSAARNAGAERSAADWLIFLDADDELDPHYIEEMLKGHGDVRQPMTLGVHADGHEDDYPVLIPPKLPNFLCGNHLVIGSMVRRDLFLRVGGFRDLTCLEDWDLWIRCLLDGAQFGTSQAVYRVHVRPESRNKDVSLHSAVYSEIQQRYQRDMAMRGLI